jgi:hypothetical protein
MKLTIINNPTPLEQNFFGIEVTTDNHVYSIFEDHNDIMLLLKNATIKSIDSSYKKNIEYQNIDGIFIFKNNNIRILKSTEETDNS